MYRIFCVCVAFIACALFPAQSSPASLEEAPGRDIPVPLQKVWLHFHEADLCQGVDAVFTFNKDGVQIHCVVEDEKSYEKLQQMLEPLRNAYKIDLTAKRPTVDKDPDEKKNPPASLWENYELRSFLGDPFAQAKQRPGFEPSAVDLPPPSEILKQQLIIYSEQTLDWTQRMERYAEDLPALAHAAFDSSSVPELRPQAAAICKAHAQALERYIAKLDSSLKEALPSAGKKHRSKTRGDSRAGSNGLVNQAYRLSKNAQEVAGKIHAFIHPEVFTVGLEELREPSLLDLLQELHKMDLEFMKSLDKAGRS